MDDRDVIIIEEYIQQCSIKPEINPREPFFFDLSSYSRWAVDEILRRTMCEAMKLPPHISGKESLSLIDVVENFIDDMDCYTHFASSDRAKEIFEIARDEGKCVLLYICSSKEKENANE